jgi:predicted RNase H-like HicB family nuclease
MDSVEAQTALRERYLKRPYHVVLISDGEDGWIAQVEELPGCEVQASTPDEAAHKIREAMETWIAEAIEHRRAIPRPRRDPARGTRITLGVPESLRDALGQAAVREGLSLDVFTTITLAAAVGWKPREDESGSTWIKDRADSFNPFSGAGDRLPEWLQLAVRANVALIALAVLAALVLIIVALVNGI